MDRLAGLALTRLVTRQWVTKLPLLSRLMTHCAGFSTLLEQVAETIRPLSLDGGFLLVARTSLLKITQWCCWTWTSTQQSPTQTFASSKPSSSRDSMISPPLVSILPTIDPVHWIARSSRRSGNSTPTPASLTRLKPQAIVLCLSLTTSSLSWTKQELQMTWWSLPSKEHLSRQSCLRFVGVQRCPLLSKFLTSTRTRRHRSLDNRWRWSLHLEMTLTLAPSLPQSALIQMRRLMGPLLSVPSLQHPWLSFQHPYFDDWTNLTSLFKQKFK